jgi:hypothetical protein
MDADSLNGRFELQVTPGLVTSDDFLKFLTLTAVEEERKTAHAAEWEKRTGRKILLNVKHGDKSYLTEFENENKKPEDTPKTETPKTQQGKYSSATVDDLNAEYYRLISIPNARTNISALMDMTELMAEYKKRGIEMPDSKRASNESEQKKPWWKVW